MVADQDTELGQVPPTRTPSWMSRLTTSSMPSVTFRRSSLSPKALSRMRTHDDRESEKAVILTDEELQRQDTLIHLINNEDFKKGSLASACIWYTQYLQSKFNNNWHLLAPALVGLEDFSSGPASGDLVIVYDFIIAVAKIFKNRRDVALTDVVDDLDNRNIFKPQLDDERTIPNQIVFATLGWLTGLFDAVSNPKSESLEVTRLSTSSSGHRNPLDTNKYSSFKQGFEYIDLPLHTFLGRFGDLIPEYQRNQVWESGSSKSRSTEIILVQSVCFYTLQHLAELKIEWVTSLNLHLELDTGRKTLKLYQFPSFCRMMVIEGERNLLSRFLNDHAARNSEDARAPEIPISKFFAEILLSYRLIFGQDERSWKAFSRMMPVWEEQRGRSSWETTWDCDPLIQTLCGKSSLDSEARKLYEELRLCEPTNSYDLHDQFPFFGKRLVELQQFMKQHQPQTVRSLLSDRRDVAAWYTLWNNQVVIAFTTITIFLMFLSLFFQVWQVILAKEQIALAREQLQQPPS